MIKEKIIFGIDRKEISHFTFIELHQTINNHHTFTIKVPHSVIEKPRAYTMENAQSWMWKVVHIALENKNNFLGIITNIELDFNLDHVGSQIILTGFSKTILLESGTNLHSWEDTTLQDMVREVIKSGADEQLQNEIQPEFTHKINYQTQYEETDFQYIQRLAKQYNEWLFYDGEKLFFGKPKNIREKDKITLTFGQDLYTFKLGVKAKQTQFGAFTYNEESNKLYQAKTQHKVEGLPRLGDQAFEASEKLFNTASLEYGRIPTGDEGFLETILKKRQEAAMADANYITATSGNNKLKIGSIITINAKEEIEVNKAHRLGLDATKTNFQTQEVGTYIITEITHKATDIGEYENSFKALPAFIKTLPEAQVAFPQAQNQQAIVIDNADPKGQGRIRVKMQWQQTKNLRTQWIRVMTPDAGTSGEVPTNRGMVFIPEVGDQVMLGFRYNDPNRPFVLGSLFNGQTGIGGQANNNIKSIFTKTGSTITFDEGASSILVKDPSGNTWFMDGAGNINVTAPNLLTLNATDISVNASNNLTTNVGNVMTFNVVKNAFFNIFQKMQVNTPYLHQLITGLFHTNASKALINSDNEIKLESPEMYVAGQKKLFLHSDENAIINSKGTAQVHGTQGNKQTNNGVEYKYVPVYVDDRCIVSFRPKDNWKGEDYGFDWVRTGDTKILGDSYYKKIIGKYGSVYASKGGVLTQSDDEFRKLMREFDPHTYFIKDKKGKKKAINYCVPWLCLYPQKEIKYIKDDKGNFVPTVKATDAKNTTAVLQMTLDIEKDAEKLELEYDEKLFKITTPTLPKTKGVHKIDITITCLLPFSKDQPIKVIATYKNAKGENELSLAGKLKVMKNMNRYKVDVLFVNVSTNIGAGMKLAEPKGRATELKKYLNQGLVDPKIETVILDLSTDIDTTTKKRTNRRTNFFKKSKAVGGVKAHISDGTLDDIYLFLNEELYKSYDKAKYENHFKVYFINEDATDLYGIGRSINKDLRTILVYKLGFADSTVAHETLHSMGLYHSFDNNGDFTFKILGTDNIMDYSDAYAPFTPVNTTYHWQWKKLWKRATKIK